MEGVSSVSASSKFIPTSRRVLKALKDYGRKLANLELFKQSLEDWVLENFHEDTISDQSFTSPFSIDELRKLDLALEGVLFQQLFRMPCSPYASDDSKEDEYFAIEDFLHAVVNGLWRTFWHKSRPLPFILSCPFRPGSKFYTVQKAISRGRLEELCGLALISKIGTNPQVHRGQVVELSSFRPDILSGNELKLSTSYICEALFYGIHILIARSLSKLNTSDSDSVFLLVFYSKFASVVKLGGDLSTLELKSTNLYQSVTEWIKRHAEVRVSPVDQVWNKLGNANWWNIGTLQVLLATFYSIFQWNGPPRKSIASLVLDYSLRIQKRRTECFLSQGKTASVHFQQMGHQGEVVQFNQSDDPSRKQSLCLKLRQGEVLLLEDQQQGHKSFQIQNSLVGGNYFLYSAVSLDHPTELLTLYVGAHPHRLEPSWEGMSLWYQVQRQTKVLNILKQRGITSKYLPEKISPGDCCNHPWCGTPILVTSPVGEQLSLVVAQDNSFSSEEAVRYCRDCLVGNVLPRAVLEDRDSPGINLQFSSSHTLQHGKFCLIYLLYFVCGGPMQQQDSIESALQWRERSWANRSIQQQLGEVSALLKAFADYVDSLCGTPYPVDYDVWLKRLNRAVDGSADRGKMVQRLAIIRLEDVAECSGASGGGI
ncbi:hypothetical protein P3X46_018279 [Hevea brasiliensis]|uniref:Uncharacterized protein n=1 Tax=Hevea brasiliensis TaxID=3981 RepID=A0ABQ9LU88_HEVBR|nr:hypothetical protein P3X46_018279 [Hevea brasiliensis]